MPLTAKGEEIKSALTKEYGEAKGERVLYAGKNKGTFSGIDAEPYAKVLENARAAQREYSEAQKKYRARDIGDKEFLAAKKKYEKSEEEFSKARGEHPSQHKLDSDTLDRIADCADRLSARLDAMVDADNGALEKKQKDLAAMKEELAKSSGIKAHALRSIIARYKAEIANLQKK